MNITKENMIISKRDLKKLNEKFEKASPEEILDFAIKNLCPDLATITSFQISGIVILHMFKKLGYDPKVYFIDTGYHFKETLEQRDNIADFLQINVETIKPTIKKTDFEKKYGKNLSQDDPDTCCNINKVVPQKRLIEDSNIHHWISGIRKDQSDTRNDYSVFMMDSNNKIRIHPLINWTKKETWNYIIKNNIPYNKLYDRGYNSIGCEPCTNPSTNSNDERSGRWENSHKTECGLHLSLKN